MTFQNKFSAKQFVPAHVRCSNELGKYLEVGFLNPHRTVRCLAVLQHEEVTKKRLRTFKICSLSECSPEIKGASNGLLCPVVEIISKRGSNLRLGFKGANQRSVSNNEEVPFFGGLKKPGSSTAFFLNTFR